MNRLTLEEIRQAALQFGYDDVGVAPAKIPEQDIKAYLAWLKRGHHASLTYMENQLRSTTEHILPGAKSAILFITYYKQPHAPFTQHSKTIASYARGRDYHNVHRARLKKFITWLENRSQMKGCARGFSDSKPLLEKALAVQAGLGWFGKNTLLIHRKFGTFTLLSGVLTTLDLPFTSKDALIPHENRCGSCTRCLDACPTKALTPFNLNAARCLSYHLIESKDPLPEEIISKNPGYLFGCDICQDVCPHNARKKESRSLDFKPEKGMGAYLSLEELQQLSSTPEKLNGTPLKRRGLHGLMHTSDPKNFRFTIV